MIRPTLFCSGLSLRRRNPSFRAQGLPSHLVSDEAMALETRGKGQGSSVEGGTCAWSLLHHLPSQSRPQGGRRIGSSETSLQSPNNPLPPWTSSYKNLVVGRSFTQIWPVNQDTVLANLVGESLAGFELESLAHCGREYSSGSFNYMRCFTSPVKLDSTNFSALPRREVNDDYFLRRQRHRGAFPNRRQPSLRCYRSRGRAQAYRR